MRVIGLLTVMGMVASTSAAAVPSFVRQTGLACNQCHITFGAPVPNFTFTGKKFRMNGYRLPYTSLKVEAGEEGALNGNRLAMSLWPYLSFRFQSTIAAQTKAPGSTQWSKVSSNPTSRFAIFPVGAFGDHFALWSELYETPDGSTTEQWGQGIVTFDEYDLRYSTSGDWGNVGLAFTNQSVLEVGGFGPWPVGVTGFFNGGTYRGWAHPNRGTFAAYGFFKDMLFATIGAGPGDDNLLWGRDSYQAQLAYAPWHTDHREMWVVSSLQFGQDGIPLTTVYQPSKDGTLSWRYLDNIFGVSATRPSGQPYLSRDMKHFVRSTSEVRYGFSNHGPHSLEADARLSINKEKYLDGADATDNAVGGAIRYAYNHTWGVDAVLDKPFRYRFTDHLGTEHDVTNDVAYTTYLSYRPAMNLLVSFSYANAQRYSIGAIVPNGQNWSMIVDFLF